MKLDIKTEINWRVLQELNIAIADEKDVLERLDMIQLRNDFIENTILVGSE